MEKKITFKDIIKSKVSNKDNMPSWYHKRMEICNGCEFNSKNRDKLNLKEKAIVLGNGGKPSCLECGCEIAAKASLPHAKCPLASPRWKSIGRIAKTASMEIENISTTPLEIRENKGELWLDYGTIKVGQETDVRLLIKDIKGEMSNLKVNATCGCTKTKLEKEGDDTILNIVYDTKRIGPFTKTVVLTYRKNNTNYKNIFKITGKTK